MHSVLGKKLIFDCVGMKQQFFTKTFFSKKKKLYCSETVMGCEFLVLLPFLVVMVRNRASIIGMHYAFPRLERITPKQL